MPARAQVGAFLADLFFVEQALAIHISRSGSSHLLQNFFLILHSYRCERSLYDSVESEKSKIQILSFAIDDLLLLFRLYTVIASKMLNQIRLEPFLQAQVPRISNIIHLKQSGILQIFDHTSVDFNAFLIGGLHQPLDRVIISLSQIYLMQLDPVPHFLELIDQPLNHVFLCVQLE